MMKTMMKMTTMTNQRGSVLVMTLFLLALFVVILGAWSQFAARQAHVLIDQEQEEVAFQIAEAGVNFTLHSLNSGEQPDNIAAAGQQVHSVTDLVTGEEIGRYELDYSYSPDDMSLSGLAKGYVINRPELCQKLDVTYLPVVGASDQTYYLSRFDHDISAPCADQIPPVQN